jgi:hypothetical protein
MSRGKGESKAQRKGRAGKLAVKKELVKDLAPKRGMKAGAASTTDAWMRQARNHNETLARDTARKHAGDK